jgi:4'-phosphopantetheinyl transferase
VQVFRFPLDVDTRNLAALTAVLTPDEAARADRYHFARDRRRFTVARATLRRILAHYLQRDPSDLRFDYNPYGKPALAGESTTAGDLGFNLSHSADLALLAVTRGLEVGIDVESVRLEIDRLNLARRFFGPAETAALLALPPEQQVGAFYACWTRKEAYLKARGSGLSESLKSFQVSIEPGQPPRLIATETGSVDDWTLVDLQPWPGFAATLAVEGPLAGVRCWSWVVM